MSRVGVLFTRSGWRGVDSAVGIDTALAALAFEHEVDVAFVGAGVELLVRGDSSDERAQRERMIAALLHHGARSLRASSDCLERRALVPHVSGVEQMPLSALHAWLAGVDHVVCF